MAIIHAPTALSSEQLRKISGELEQAMTALYGTRLDRIVLYGSYARGDFHAESDIDYLVVLRDEVIKGGAEIRRMSPAIGLIALNYEVEISIFPTTLSHYLSSDASFYETIRAEGITV
jgi:predicted nucleotidyltransferase